MKKVLITRRLIRESEYKASKLFEAKFNTNDELYSQKKIIEISEGCDGILSSLKKSLFQYIEEPWVLIPWETMHLWFL